MRLDRAEEALRRLKGILDAAGIEFFLIQGTALGAYRDKDFIEGDKDIDIGILFENFDPEMRYSGFQRRTISKPFNFCRTHKLDYGDVHIDVTTYMKNGDERFSHSSHRDYAVVQPARIMENYEQIELRGNTFFVPSPIEEYLENEYGDWRTKSDETISKSRVYGYLQKESIRTTLGRNVQG